MNRSTDELRASPARQLGGRLRVPGDKSISHRGLLLGAVGVGPSRLRGSLDGNDCRATARCLESLGVTIRHQGSELIIEGRGLAGLGPPQRPLDCNRSGTTMRLLCGLLAGQRFDSRLVGDPQLQRRPMARVVEPLEAMGARIDSEAGRAPLGVHGGVTLRGRRHELTLSSAQVKSAVLLAGLYAAGTTRVRQPTASRDHTERLLAAMGATVEVLEGGAEVSLSPGPALLPLDLEVPGDFSSAAFPLVAATLVGGSELLLEGVGVNPTRTGLLDALAEMGAAVTLENRRERSGEPLADIRVRASELRATEVGGAIVTRMIDALPFLAVAAPQASGSTVIRDAAELRVKETDRIATTAASLSALGARVSTRPDGLVIDGPTPLRGATVSSDGDHRLAMAIAVAGLVARAPVTVKRAGCIADSFPGFVQLMRSVGAPLAAPQEECP